MSSGLDLGGGGGGGSGVLLIIGAALLLKPKDLYTVGRVAGRICGSAVFSLRGVRAAFSSAMSHKQTPKEYEGVRDKVLDSFKQLEDIGRTVSREVASSSPMAGFRAATMFKPKQKNSSTSLLTTASGTNSQIGQASPTPTPQVTSTPSETQQMPSKLTPTILTSVTPSSGMETGSMIVTRVIEEGAFAEEQAKLLGMGHVDDSVDKTVKG